MRRRGGGTPKPGVGLIEVGVEGLFRAHEVMPFRVLSNNRAYYYNHSPLLF